jgi:hypothetical protein
MSPNADYEGTPLGEKLVSPHAFDGGGPVPDEVVAAARRIANLRVKFLTAPWHQYPDQEWLFPLTAHEVEELFTLAAIQAEWMRELLDYRDSLPPIGRSGTP